MAEVVPGVTRFEEVWPRSASRDDLLVRLGLPGQWRMALAGLYLSTGRLVPEEARRRGCYFGFCAADGSRVADVRVSGDGAGCAVVVSPATHVGWTVG